MSSPWQRWRAHDQAYNKTFRLKLKSYKFNACLAITGAIKGSSREKIYQELRLETLRKRCWLCRLYLFYKIQKNKLPSQLFRLIPNTSGMHVARNSNNSKGINAKHNFLKNYFCIRDKWMKQAQFENSWFRDFGILYKLHNPRRIKLLRRLTVGLSHLKTHKFKQNFQEYIDPNIIAQRETSVTETFLCGKFNLIVSLNKEIINAAIGFIMPTKCFNCPLFSSWPISLWGSLMSSFHFGSILTFLFIIIIWFSLSFDILNRGVVSSLA